MNCARSILKGLLTRLESRVEIVVAFVLVFSMVFPVSTVASTSHVPSHFSTQSILIDSSHSAPSRVTPAGSASLSNYSLAVLTNFDGVNAPGSCDVPFDRKSVCNPPDMGLAVGPNQIVEMVNRQVYFFSKNGVLIQNENLSTFWGVFQPWSDPEVLYDVSSQRFYASIINTASFQVYFAVSLSSNATAGWKIYPLPQLIYSGSPPSGGCIVGTSLFPDQPILGINNDKVSLSDNSFCGNILLGAHFWILNKTEVLSGASSLHMASIGPLANTESVHPVQSLSSTNTEYMVSTGAEDLGTSGNIVALYSVTGAPPGQVTYHIANLTLNSFISGPPGALEANTTQTVWCVGTGSTSCNDARVLDAKWYLGKLWYSLNEGCTPPGDSQTRTCVRLTEIDTATPTVIQDFDYDAVGQYYYYPALGIDASGNLAVIYGFSSSSTYPSLAATAQGFNDPVATMRIPKVLVTGLSDSLSGRYGDYFGGATDPIDASMVWIAGEYYGSITGECLPQAQTGPCWSTRIASTRVEDFSITANPTSIALLAGSLGNSTITATRINGFQGTVSLTVSITPSSGLVCSASPSSLTLGSSASSTLSCGQGSAGNYTVTVTGSNGVFSHSTTVSVRVTDFSVTAPPGINCISLRGNCRFSVTVTSVNGFAGTVQLSSSSGSVSPSSITLSAGSSGSATVTFSAGPSSVSVTYTSGTLVHRSTTHVTYPQ